MEAACVEPLRGEPGKTYRYSDINFIILGLLVERITGEPLDQFCKREIFTPLGMTDCHFRTLAEKGLKKMDRIAPTTEMSDGSALRGVVHDPTARRMGAWQGTPVFF